MKYLLFAILAFSFLRAEAFVGSCLRKIRNTFATKDAFKLSEYQSELARLQKEFPRHGVSIQKRHRKFLELYQKGQFDTPEKLLAATAHFYDNKDFNLSAAIEKNLDKIIIQKRLDLLKEPLSKKGEIRLSEELPTNEAEYYDWLSQTLNIFHHAELHDIAFSVSTNPLSSKGTFVTNYKSRIEDKIQESDNSYRAFIARISRVAPKFKNKFPEYVPQQGWFPYVLNSAHYVTLLRHPWTEISKRPLSSEDSGVNTNHQLYWPRWIAANQARVGMLIGTAAGTLFGAYALSLDEDDLEAIAKENAPEFAKGFFNIDTKKMSEEHGIYYNNQLVKRKSEIGNRLTELGGNNLIKEEIEEKEALENELKELNE